MLNKEIDNILSKEDKQVPANIEINISKRS
jgi:hypothetical protein